MKLFNYLIIFIIAFLLGALWRQFQIYPFHQLQNLRYQLTIKNFVKKYKAGDPLFSNRYYVNSRVTDLLKDTILIRIPRHFRKNICFKVDKNVKVLRLVSDSYPKFTYKDVVEVRGQSDIKKHILVQNYNKGEICLNYLEKVSASPIFVKNSNLLNKIKDTIYIK